MITAFAVICGVEANALTLKPVQFAKGKSSATVKGNTGNYGATYVVRAKRRDDLIKIEGEKTFEELQRFFAVVYRLSSERRLSRFVFVAAKNKV